MSLIEPSKCFTTKLNKARSPEYEQKQHLYFGGLRKRRTERNNWKGNLKIHVRAWVCTAAKPAHSMTHSWWQLSNQPTWAAATSTTKSQGILTFHIWKKPDSNMKVMHHALQFQYIVSMPEFLYKRTYVLDLDERKYRMTKSPPKIEHSPERDLFTVISCSSINWTA